MKEALFEISLRDLEASKLLFKNELYPQAVFYFQQSVEKATKLFGVLGGIITLKEAREDVKHNTFKIYKKMMKGLWEDVKAQEVVKEYPLLGKTKIVEGITSKVSSEKINEYLNSLTDIDRKRAYSSPFEKDIDSVIKFLDRIESGLDRSSLPSILSEQKLKESEEKVEELLNVFSDQNPETVKKVKNGVDELLAPESRDKVFRIGEFWTDLFYVHFSLFVLSLITPPFLVGSARYPDEKGQSPADIYNEKHPLIQSYNDLVRIMEKTLSKMENLFLKEQTGGE